eukprot:gene13498-biopygen498
MVLGHPRLSFTRLLLTDLTKLVYRSRFGAAASFPDKLPYTTSSHHVCHGVGQRGHRPQTRHRVRPAAPRRSCACRPVGRK